MLSRLKKVLVMAVFVVAFSSFMPTVSGADFNATQSANIQITFDIPETTSTEEPVAPDTADAGDEVVSPPNEAPVVEAPPISDTPPIEEPLVTTPPTTIPVADPVPPAPVTPPEEVPVSADAAPVVTEVTDVQDLSLPTDLEGALNEEISQ